MEKLESMLDGIFEMRVNEVAGVTAEERMAIQNMKAERELKDFLPNATKEEKQKIEEYVENVKENIAVEMGFFNEKYYKNGFADAIKLVMECMKK